MAAPRGESIQAEATRRGLSYFTVRQQRLREATGATYRQHREERFRAQKIRNIRAAAPEDRPEWVQADPEAWGQFPAPPPPGELAEEPHGMQGPFGPSPTPAWDYYWPTRTINPRRPRTLQARYSANQRRLEVIFRDGTPWHYDSVPPGIWTRFKRIESPGRYINAVLNGYPCGRGGWG